MRYLLLLNLIILATCIGHAQKFRIPDYTHAIMEVKNVGSGNMRISMDYGHKKVPERELAIRNENGITLKQLTSMVDALNFLAEQGWEVFQFLSESTSPTHKLLLRRKLTDMEKMEYLPKKYE